MQVDSYSSNGLKPLPIIWFLIEQLVKMAEASSVRDGYHRWMIQVGRILTLMIWRIWVENCSEKLWKREKNWGIQRSDTRCAIGASASHPSWTCTRAGGNFAIFFRLCGTVVQRFPKLCLVLDIIDVLNPAAVYR